MNVTIDVKQCIAEIVATSFDAGRSVLRRYSATAVLHSPERYPTQKCIGYGEDETEARHNATGAALLAWGWTDLDRMDFVEEVRVSSRALPDEYGILYLADADKCMALANRMPAESQAYKDMMAVAEWYEREYLAVRYEYLRNY